MKILTVTHPILVERALSSTESRVRMEHPPVQSAGVFESLVSVFFSSLVDSCVLGIQFSPHLTSIRPHVEGREDDSLEPRTTE